MFDLVWLIPLFPLLGVLINGTTGWKNSGNRPASSPAPRWDSRSSSRSPSLSTLLQLPAPERLVELHLFKWIAAGSLCTEIGFQFDPLSMVMMLVVTGVSFIIHIYAIGYMHGDRGFNALFHLPESVRLCHAPPGDGEQFSHDVHRLGRRGPLFLSSHRLLV